MNDSPELIVEDPPPSANGTDGGSSTPFSRWFDALRERPGAWHRWPTPMWHTQASEIKRGKRKYAREGEFEIITRHRPGEAKRDMYARYIGPVGGE